MGLLRDGVVDAEHYLEDGFPSLTFLLFYEEYTSIEGQGDYFSRWCVMYL
jgi:hypothetical protein